MKNLFCIPLLFAACQLIFYPFLIVINILRALPLIDLNTTIFSLEFMLFLAFLLSTVVLPLVLIASAQQAIRFSREEHHASALLTSLVPSGWLAVLHMIGWSM